MRETYLLPHGRVLRYSFRERLMHWVAGFSYVYLLLTGPFGIPASAQLALLAWLAAAAFVLLVETSPI